MHFSGCSSIQENYKPLYQVKPEKVEAKAEVKVENKRKRRRR
jgi:hypothetical protein